MKSTKISENNHHWLYFEKEVVLPPYWPEGKLAEVSIIAYRGNTYASEIAFDDFEFRPKGCNSVVEDVAPSLEPTTPFPTEQTGWFTQFDPEDSMAKREYRPFYDQDQNSCEIR